MSLKDLNSWKLLPVWCGLGVLCAVLMLSDFGCGAINPYALEGQDAPVLKPLPTGGVVGGITFSSAPNATVTPIPCSAPAATSPPSPATHLPPKAPLSATPPWPSTKPCKSTN